MKDLKTLKDNVGNEIFTGMILSGVGKKWLYVYSRWLNDRGVNRYSRILISDYLENTDFEFHNVILSRIPKKCR